jgi:hypothetical protein
MAGPARQVSRAAEAVTPGCSATAAGAAPAGPEPSAPLAHPGSTAETGGPVAPAVAAACFTATAAAAVTAARAVTAPSGASAARVVPEAKVRRCRATRVPTAARAATGPVLDFDVEGALQGNAQAMNTQSKAIAILQQQEAANGTPVTVSYTLPVLPTGLVEGQGGGLNVLQIAATNGVDVSRVNIMTMDYGNGFDQTGNPGMGAYAIDAATATHTQLMTLYPSLTSQQAWHMLGVTPLIGINDDPSEIFGLADAQQLTTFAQQNNIGELSMWELPRDVTGTLGAVDAVDGSGIPQTPFEFSGIFEGIEPQT